MTWMIRHGDVLERLAEMPDESVNCVVTSPPYWGLRDYGTATWEGGDADCRHLPNNTHQRQGQSGDRANPDFTGFSPFKAECGNCGARRIDAQLGLEATPEEYVTTMTAVFREVRRVLRSDGTCWINLGDSYTSGGRKTRDPGQSKKHPAMEDWQGGRPDNPPGLKDKDLVGVPWRLAFALQADGWYLRSDIIWAKPNPMPESVTDRPTKAHEYIFLLTKSARYWYDAEAIREPQVSDHPSGNGFKRDARLTYLSNEGARGCDEQWRPSSVGRNKRTVWEVATEPFRGAHFATFPTKLIEPCILAGCPEGGTVLDPFAGSGTTLMVALRHGRNAIGIELNPEYVEMARRRIEDDHGVTREEVETMASMAAQGRLLL